MPPIAQDSGHLFQSDDQLRTEQRRLQKKKEIASASLGGCLRCPSKVLALERCAGQPDHLLVAESGFLLRLVDLSAAPPTADVTPAESASEDAGRSGWGKTVQTFRGHQGPVTSCASMPTADGNHVVVSGSWDKTVRVWDMQSGQLVRTIDGHGDFVKCVRLFRYTGTTAECKPFASSTEVVFSGSSDSKIRAWDLATGTMLRKWEGHRRAVEDVVLNATGTILYSASSDGTIRKFDVNSGECLAVLEGHQTSVYSLFLPFDDDEETLWSASADNTVVRWNLQTSKMDTTFRHPDWVKTFVVAGPYLITGSRDETIRIWDIATGKCLRKLDVHHDEVSALVLMGSRLLSGSYDCSIREWNIAEEISKRSGNSVEKSEEQPETKVVVGLTEDEERELMELM